MPAIMKVFFLLFVPCDVHQECTRQAMRCIGAFRHMKQTRIFPTKKQQKQQQQKLMNKKIRLRNHTVQNEDRTHKHIKTQTANAGIE